ncbi:MAG: cysteine desulfurase family protein [Pseudomonadota bacterium]
MPAHRAYLDHNATSPLRPAAREAMLAAMDSGGNPSSVHAEGRGAKGMMETARAQVAALVGARPDNVIFTSGATEAAHLALTPSIHVDSTEHIAPLLYRSTTEHPCVEAMGRFPAHRVVPLAVDGTGTITDKTLDAMFHEHDDAQGPLFVAVQMVNSETGVIQPVADIARRVRLRGGFTLTDAVQAAGRIPLSIGELGVDFMMLSAHKLGGPQGVGALVLGAANVTPLPFPQGGGQERGFRSGTENVPGIAGFGAAAAEAAQEAQNYARISTLRDSIEARLAPICETAGLSGAPNIFGEGAQRVGNTSAFAVPGLRAETALIGMDLEGVAISSGSACSSGKVGRSQVLSAMGVDADLAGCALRVSLGWNSTAEDADTFCAALERILKRAVSAIQPVKTKSAA